MAKNGSSEGVLHDFYKTNGLDHSIGNWGPSLTRQEFADDCDINNIMARYANGEIPSFVNQAREPTYVDFTSMPSDLMGALDASRRAAEAFMTLPAEVRREFDNDPIKFVDFASDKENLPQLQTWGLAPKPKAPEPPMRVEVVNPAPADKPPGDAPKPPVGG